MKEIHRSAVVGAVSGALGAMAVMAFVVPRLKKWMGQEMGKMMHAELGGYGAGRKSVQQQGFRRGVRKYS